MEVLIRHAGGKNFSKRIRFAPCLFVGSEYTFILFWQAFSCSHQFLICPYFPLHSHCCQLIHNFLYTQYIHINKSIFATKWLSVNNSGTLCQGENCLITMFNLVIPEIFSSILYSEVQSKYSDLPNNRAANFIPIIGIKFAAQLFGRSEYYLYLLQPIQSDHLLTRVR